MRVLYSVHVAHVHQAVMLHRRYADNWITEVYSGYKPALMVKRDDYPVDHKLAPQRYLPVKTPGFFKMYQQQMDIGKAAIKAFTQRQFNATPAAA